MRSFMGWTALAIAVAVGYGYSLHNSATIRGSGTTKAETRDVGDFDGIVVGSAMKATVTIGSKASLKIEADDNLLPLIETPIKSGHLIVQFKDGTPVEPKSPILLTITAPRLSYIDGSGASVVVATATKSDKFEISSSGASKVDASGVDSADVTVSASGASRLKLTGTGKTIKIDLSGAS
ncbi:MAG TPA: DUF2807 domain-containing protein, partial [Isosphaeraceae bacterium]|nr:DUF2807 domain-containing protein [Isosphaeraceae bacterium]